MTPTPENPLDLPAGLNDFEQIRSRNLYYADKTMFLYKLIDRWGPNLLARPRGFGKTLLLSAMERLLEGRRDLFGGLWIDGSDHDWKPCPVLRLDMAKVKTDDPEAIGDLASDLIGEAAKRRGVKVKRDVPQKMVADLLKSLSRLNGGREKVALLVDDYDAPVAGLVGDPEKAEKARRRLFDFYEGLRKVEETIGYCLFAATQRFNPRPHQFFYGLRLYDVTFGDDFAAACGFTEDQLGELLERGGGRALGALVEAGTLPPGADVEDLRRLLKDWYGGYRWNRGPADGKAAGAETADGKAADGKTAGGTTLYNPSSVISFLNQAELRNYWNDPAETALAAKLLQGLGNHFDLTRANTAALRSDELEDVATMDMALYLLHSGHLTIKEGWNRRRGSCPLGLPNAEVAATFCPAVLGLRPPVSPLEARRAALGTRDALLALDREALEASFGRFAAQFPQDVPGEGEDRCPRLLMAALSLADQNYTAMLDTSREALHLRLKPGNGDLMIVSPRLLAPRPGASGESPRAKEADPGDAAPLAKRMEARALDVLRIIGEDYSRTAAKGPGRLIKVALVVAGGGEVLARLEVVEPPRPAKEPG